MNIDTPLVQRLVADQFPQWADLPIHPVTDGGWDNRTFHLGDEMSVRLPSAERYAAKVAIEQMWLPRLARHLPLPIPVPLAMGTPAHGYPWHWSIYRWLEGDNASVGRINDLSEFARALAEFLLALQKIDPMGGPTPGPHNFFRGGSLMTYDGETREAIVTLRGKIDADAATEVWEAAMASSWRGTPVWIHGDVSRGNLLVCEGRLSAVIDFGGMAVGDPACDLTIAWTLLEGESRRVFHKTLPLDAGVWARARGWALWKALITLDEHIGTDIGKSEAAGHVIDTVIVEDADGLS